MEQKEGKKMKFSEIKQLPKTYYRVNVSWDFLEHQIDRYKEEYNLEMQPDFQRAHVWTEEQQRKYVEWIMSGGFSGKDVFVNYPDWGNFSKYGRHPFPLIQHPARIRSRPNLLIYA